MPKANRPDDVEWEYREENLAGAYLAQSVESLLSAGDPKALYPKRGQRDAKQLLLDMMVAASKRLEFARTSILFSALAAEAYINQFLAREGARAGIAKNDLEGLDRLPTTEKFVLGPRLVIGSAVFGRGRAPIQEIRALFKLRGLLVHPKARSVKVRKHQLFDRPGYEDYNPEAAARFVVAVSKAAVALSEATDPPGPVDRTARGITAQANPILEIGRAVRENLPSAPGPIPILPRIDVPTTATGPLPQST